ncbi:MAG: hypothetical protein EBX40_03700, partial [Gammaproteobacteria bacterium]|nr:hypothetical protein [Gammaproteobacteria bacterium]
MYSAPSRKKGRDARRFQRASRGNESGLFMDLKSIETLFKNAGLEPRQAQFDMMQRISTCLEKKQIIVVEGGTGIGKTYAYLIAALLTKAAKTKIVLATATINLQLQLIEKDIPHIAKLLNLSFKAVLAKGRRRYVCPSRLMHQGSALSQGELAFFNVDSAESRRTKRSKEDESLINDLVQRFENERWEGDRDELEMHVPEDLWQEISTDAPGCSGKRCIYFNDCPYFKAKRRIYGADLIVANHDLLLSDIALGTGALLPDSEQTLYIIDEAHHFPKKTVEHFASNTSLLGSRAWLARIQTLKKRLKTVFSDSAESLKNLEDDVLQLQDALLHMHQYLDPILSGKNDHEPWILSPVPPELSGLAHPIIQYAHRIQNTLYHFRKQLT